MLKLFEEVTAEQSASTAEVGTVIKRVSAIDLPEKLKKFQGQVRGRPAPGNRIAIDTPMNRVQRPLKQNSVAAYIEKSQGLDWNLFGYVTAVIYPNGEMEVINGQHRMTVALTVDPTITEVPAHIVSVDTDEYAARLFGLMNGGATRNVSREERLWADIIARDPEALRIEKLLKDCNYACGQVNTEDGRERKQIKLATFEKCAQLGVKELNRAAELCHRAWPDNDNHNQLLHGLTRLFTHKEYQCLMDIDSPHGRRFEEWFIDVLPMIFSYKQIQFPQYRQHMNWSFGIAYGLISQYRIFAKKQKHYAPSVTPAKSAYEAGWKDTDNDNTDEGDE